MNHRKFAGTVSVFAAAGAAVAGPDKAGKPFSLLYVPGFCNIENSAGKDPLDRIPFMCEQDFRTVEDNRLMNRPAAK